jgi:hypothetical protein
MPDEVGIVVTQRGKAFSACIPMLKVEAHGRTADDAIERVRALGMGVLKTWAKELNVPRPEWDGKEYENNEDEQAGEMPSFNFNPKPPQFGNKRPKETGLGRVRSRKRVSVKRKV